MSTRTARRCLLLSVYAAAGCGGSKATPGAMTTAMPAARPWSPPPHAWQVQVGVARQRTTLAALGVTDRAAWLATNPRLIVRLDGPDRGRAQLAYPFVAAPDDRASVELVGYFGPTAEAREAAWAPMFHDRVGELSIALERDRGTDGKRAEVVPTRVKLVLEDPTGDRRLTYQVLGPRDARLGAGTLAGGQVKVQVGPFTIQLSTPAAPRPRPLSTGTGDWHPSIGLLRRRVPLAALGVTDRAAWLARNPRVELVLAGDRIAAPFVAAADDPAAVELLGFFGRDADAGDELLSTSARTASGPDDRSGGFELALVADDGPAGALVGGAERASVTYGILSAGCRPKDGCIADGISFQLYAADGVTRIGGGRAREPTDGGVRVIAIGPVEVGIHLPDLGGGGGPD